MSSASSSPLLFNEKPLDKYERILAKYDWQSSRPPRGYQPGVGRGAKLIVTTAELRVGVGVGEEGHEKGLSHQSTQGSSTGEVDHLLDELEEMEEHRLQRRRRAEEKKKDNGTEIARRGGGTREEEERAAQVREMIGTGARVQPEDLLLPSLSVGGSTGVSSTPHGKKSKTTASSSSTTALSAEEVNAILTSSASSVVHVHNPSLQLTTRQAREEGVEKAEEYLFEDERGITMNDMVKARQLAADKNLEDLLGMGSPEEQTTWITHSRAYRESGQWKKAMATLVEGCRRTGHKGVAIWEERLSYYPLVMMPASKTSTSFPSKPHTHVDSMSYSTRKANSLEDSSTAPKREAIDEDEDEDEDDALAAEGETTVDLVGSSARRRELEAAVAAYPTAPKLWLWLLQVVLPHERLERTQEAILACPTCEVLWWELLSLTPTVEDQKKLLLRALQRTPQLPSLWGKLGRLEGAEKGRKIFHAAGQRYPSLALAVEAAKFTEWEGLRWSGGTLSPSRGTTERTSSTAAAVSFSFPSLVRHFSSLPCSPLPLPSSVPRSTGGDTMREWESTSFCWWGSVAGQRVAHMKDEIKSIMLSAASVYLQPQVATSREAWIALATQAALTPRDAFSGDSPFSATTTTTASSASSFYTPLANGSTRGHETTYEEEENIFCGGANDLSVRRRRRLQHQWKQQRGKEEQYGWTASYMFAMYVWPEWVQYKEVYHVTRTSRATGKGYPTTIENTAHAAALPSFPTDTATARHHTNEADDTPKKREERRKACRSLLQSLRLLLFPSSSGVGAGASLRWIYELVELIPTTAASVNSEGPQTEEETMRILFSSNDSTPSTWTEEEKRAKKWNCLPMGCVAALLGMCWILMEEHQHLTAYLKEEEEEEEERQRRRLQGEEVPLSATSTAGYPMPSSHVRHPGSSSSFVSLDSMEWSGCSGEMEEVVIQLMELVCSKVDDVCASLSLPSLSSVRLWYGAPLLQAWKWSIQRHVTEKVHSVVSPTNRQGELPSSPTPFPVIKKEAIEEEEGSLPSSAVHPEGQGLACTAVEVPTHSLAASWSTLGTGDGAAPWDTVTPLPLLSRMVAVFSHSFPLKTSWERQGTITSTSTTSFSKDLQEEEEVATAQREALRAQGKHEETVSPSSPHYRLHESYVSLTLIESLLLLFLCTTPVGTHAEMDHLDEASFRSTSPTTTPAPPPLVSKGTDRTNVVKKEEEEEGPMRVPPAALSSTALHHAPESFPTARTPIGRAGGTFSSRFFCFTPRVVLAMADTWMSQGHYMAAQAILHAGFHHHCVPSLALLVPSSSSTLGSSTLPAVERSAAVYEAAIRYLLSLARLLSTATAGWRVKAINEEEAQRMEEAIEPVLAMAASFPPPFRSASTPSSSQVSFSLGWPSTSGKEREVSALPWMKWIIHRRATPSAAALPFSLLLHSPSSLLELPSQFPSTCAAPSSPSRGVGQDIPEKSIKEEESEEAIKEAKKKSSCAVLRECMDYSLDRFPQCEELWLMRLAAEAGWIKESLRQYDGSSARPASLSSSPFPASSHTAALPSMEEAWRALPRWLAQHQHTMRDLCHRALQQAHCRLQVKVWIFCAVQVESELFSNIGAARATLVEAEKVCAGGALEHVIAARRRGALRIASQQPSKKGVTHPWHTTSATTSMHASPRPVRSAVSFSSFSTSTTASLFSLGEALTIEECSHILLTAAKVQVERRHHGALAARGVIEELLQALPKTIRGGGSGGGSLLLPNDAVMGTTMAALESITEAERMEWTRWQALSREAYEALGFLLSLYVELAPLSTRGKAALQALTYWPAPHHPLILLAVAKVYHHAGVMQVQQEREREVPMPMKTDNEEDQAPEASSRPPYEAEQSSSTPAPSTSLPSQDETLSTLHSTSTVATTANNRSAGPRMPPLLIKAMKQVLKALEYSHGRCGDAVALLWEWCEHPAYEGIVETLKKEITRHVGAHGSRRSTPRTRRTSNQTDATGGQEKSTTRSVKKKEEDAEGKRRRETTHQGAEDEEGNTTERRRTESMLVSALPVDSTPSRVPAVFSAVDTHQGPHERSSLVPSLTVGSRSREDTRWLVYCVTAYFQGAERFPPLLHSTFPSTLYTSVSKEEKETPPSSSSLLTRGAQEACQASKNREEVGVPTEDAPLASAASVVPSQPAKRIRRVLTMEIEVPMQEKNAACTRCPSSLEEEGSAGGMHNQQSMTTPSHHRENAEEDRWNGTRDQKKKEEFYFFNEAFRLPKDPQSGPMWIRVAEMDDPTNLTLHGYRDSIETMLRKVRQRISGGTP